MIIIHIYNTHNNTHILCDSFPRCGPGHVTDTIVCCAPRGVAAAGAVETGLVSAGDASDVVQRLQGCGVSMLTVPLNAATRASINSFNTRKTALSRVTHSVRESQWVPSVASNRSRF